MFQLPLDYGGYSKERINAHVQPIWPEDIDSFHQYEWESSQDEHNSPKQACLRSSQTKQRIRSKNLPHKSGATRQKPAAASDQTNYQNPNMEPSVLIEQLRERSGVMKFDISFPEVKNIQIIKYN